RYTKFTFLCSLYNYLTPHDLHSFPTRRSSDLSSIQKSFLDAYGVSATDQAVLRVLKMKALLAMFAQGRGQQRFHLEHAKHSLVRDRKSTRLNSSHVAISYAVSCLEKKSPSNTC